MPAVVRGAIPEPDAIYYGEVRVNGVPQSGRTVSVKRGATQLDSYLIGSTANLGNLYVLKVRLFSPATTGELAPAAGAYVGDQLSLHVDGNQVGTVTVVARGSITRLDLGSNGILTPTPSPVVTMTPTPVGGGGTPTATRTRTPTGSTTPGTRTPSPASTPNQFCYGDCNGDGKLTASDIGRINAAILRCGPCPGGIPGGIAAGCAAFSSGCVRADFNFDGCLRASEFARANHNILALQEQNGCSFITQPTPNP